MAASGSSLLTEEAAEERWNSGAQAEAEARIAQRGGDLTLLVGSRIYLFSRREGKWSEGSVEAFLPRSGKHRVIVRGTRYSVVLSSERWLPRDSAV